MTKAGVLARAAGLAAVLAAGGCWNLILQEAATVRFTEGESGERLFESAVGADFTIPAPKDQTFNGWEAESGEVLLPGQSFKVDKTLVTFRAVFVKKGNCTVQYLVGGALLYQYSYPPGAEVRIEDRLPPVNEPESGDESAASNGNVFLGWRLESGGELLAAGVLLFPRIQADARLNAVYGAPRQYTVTYLRGDSSGQMPVPNTQTGLTGAFVPIGQGYLFKDGCFFGGWKDAAGTVYAPGETYPLSGNLSLLPVWLTKCQVSYNKADSDSGSPPESRTFPAGTKIVIPGNTGNLAKAGFMFSGWRRDGADKDTAYAPGDTLEVSGDLSLSPVWATGYRVWYNGTGATGGSPPEDRTLYPAGTGTTVRGNEGSLVQAGYLFDGWRDDTTGTAYAPGEAITVSGNLSLSPVWQRLYKIQYGNGGATGGSPPTDTALYSAGAQATVRNNEGSLARTGYLFDGWQDARGARYTPGAVINVYGDLSLSPAWQKLYKVQYAGMADRGSPPKDPAYYPEGASAAVLDNEGELRRIGFVFAGWNTSPDGTGTGYAPGERLAVQGDAALYAKWVEKYRSVTFDADGGSPTEGVSVPNSGALGSLPAAPSKGELFFAGWYANRDGASPPLTAATVVEADLTVYALWTDARYVRAYGGADTNAGTAGAPLATLAEALRRADPQYAPASGATPCRKIRVSGSLALPGTVSVPGDEEVVIDGTGGGELSAAGGAYALRAGAASVRLENIAVRGLVLGSNAKAALHNVTVAPPAGGETGVAHGGELLTLSGNTTVGGVLRLVRQESRLHVEGALTANKSVAALAPWSYLPGTILPLTEDAPNSQLAHFAVSQPPGILTFRLIYTEDSRVALEPTAPAAYGSAASSAYWLENPDGSIDEVHAFTRAGADNLVFSPEIKSALERGNAAAVTALIVGGGGGGGACWGESPAVFSDTDYVSAGGGGAGEFRLARTELTSRSAINVPVSVGGGGQGGMRGHTGSRNEVSGTPGGDSLFGEYAARGGGGGGGIWDKETPRSGGPGGGRKADGGGGGAGGYGWTSLLYWHYEHPGGKGPGGGGGGNLASLPATLTTSGRCWGGGGGGGGGAGGPGGSGGNASKTNEMWGAYGRGGAGADSDISGTLLTFSAGGNGGAPENPKDYDACPNTGSGGAGGYASSGAGRRGGNGGSGIVVVRIRAASPRAAAR